MQKPWIWMAAAMLWAWQAGAQPIGLSQCIEKAMAHSALSAQLPLIKGSLDAQQSLASSSYLPRLALNGSASWQSEVTSLPISIPGIDISPPPKDQYKLSLDLQQSIWDGGTAQAQLQANRSQAGLEEARLATDLYALKETVVQLYYSAALAAAQLGNIALLKGQVEARLQKTLRNQQFGTATASQARQLQARLLELEQQENELRHKSGSAIGSLSLLMGEALPPDFQPVADLAYPLSSTSEITRPELRVFARQHELAHANKQLVAAKYSPRLSAFATLGYGRPGLNFLESGFGTYGIVGLNLRLPIDHFYSRSAQREKDLLDLQASRIDRQIQQFELLQQLKLHTQLQEIERLQQAIGTDGQLVELKTAIKLTAEQQLDQGVITPADYLDELNYELLARQNLAVHSVQLAYARLQYDLLLGKF